MSHDIVIRMEAVQAAADKFVDKPLEWGRIDCVKLAALVMRKQGVPVRLLKGVRYTNPETALRKMRKMGFDDLNAAMDATGLARIAPASAIVGDIVSARSETTFGQALLVVAGSGRLLGFDGDHICRVIVPRWLGDEAAWRVSRG